MIWRRSAEIISEYWAESAHQGLLFVWCFVANFAIGMALYLTRETGLLHWALDAERIEPDIWSALLLVGGGVAFGSVVLAVTGRFSDRLNPAVQLILFLALGIWTIQILVVPFAISWLRRDGGYEAFASTWFFSGWAITQYGAAILLVELDPPRQSRSSS